MPKNQVFGQTEGGEPMDSEKNLRSSVKKNVSKKIIGMAKKIAEMEVNSYCPLFAYQPELPDSVKKLKKF